MPLPLHIFEQRYRDLLADVADAPGGPDVRRGRAALGHRGRAAPAPATAAPTSRRSARWPRSSRSRPADDGTSDLLAVGSRRFRIAALRAGRQGLPAGRGRVPRRGRRRRSTAEQDTRARELHRGLRRDPAAAGRPGDRRRAAGATPTSCPTRSRRGCRCRRTSARRCCATRPRPTGSSGWPGYCGGRSRCCRGPAASRCPRRTADGHRRQLTARRRPAPTAAVRPAGPLGVHRVADRVGPAQVVADGERDEQPVHQRDHRAGSMNSRPVHVQRQRQVQRDLAPCCRRRAGRARR